MNPTTESKLISTPTKCVYLNSYRMNRQMTKGMMGRNSLEFLESHVGLVGKISNFMLALFSQIVKRLKLDGVRALRHIRFEMLCWFLYKTGLRDRLRCPQCRAVGTWKPHGSIKDRRCGDTRGVHRWMCKWCGYYSGPEAETQVRPCAEAVCWMLTSEAAKPMPTPQVIVREYYMGFGDGNYYLPWPWSG